MQSLILLRHAKSSWTDGDLDDHDRPLNARGNRDAPAVAALLERHPTPTHVLCSSARRTRQTLQHLIDGGAVDPDRVHIEAVLYLASEVRMHALVTDAADAVEDADAHLLVIGHNPGIEELAARLAQRPVTLKTSSLCRYERRSGEAPWRFIEQHTPRG